MLNLNVFPSRNDFASVNKHLLIPGMLALNDMEIAGFTINQKRLRIMELAYAKKLNELTDRIRSYPEVLTVEKRLGKTFNIASGDQLCDLLFNELALPTKGVNLTSSGKRLSTDKNTIAQLKDEHEIVGLLNQFKKYGVLNNTYVKPMQGHIGNDGRVHSTYMILTTTGRLKSSDLNNQNIPKNITAEDIGFDFDESLNIKYLFTPFDSDYILLEADYSQMELRVLAMYCLDDTLIGIFQRGIDVHIATGQLMADYVEPGIVVDKKSKWRQAAKCFHPDTEVLTRKGWLAMKYLTLQDEIIQAIPQDKQECIKLEWVKPTYLEIRPNDSEELIHLHSEGIDLKVTPDHRVLYKTPDGYFKISPPKELRGQNYFYNAGKLQNRRYVQIDSTLLQLAVATQADGCIVKRSSKTGSIAIRFEFKREYKIKRLRDILTKFSTEWSEHRTKNGSCVSFYIRGKLAQRIYSLLNSNKTLPWWWLDLPYQQRVLILKEVSYWDSQQHINVYIYTSIIQHNIDVLQALAAITNMKARSGSRKIDLSVSVRNKTKSNFSVDLTKESLVYVNDVAVISVPSSFILVRNNGTPVITGQCINFGVIYGEGDKKLAHELQVSEAEAKKFKHNYFNAMPGVKEFLKYVEAFVKEHKYVTTMFGNYRRLKQISSSDKWLQFEATRQAVNMPIQGTAGLYTLCSLVNLNDNFKKYHMKSRAVATVHDSIISSAHKTEVRVVAEMMEEIMLAPKNKLIYWNESIKNIPLAVEIKVSDSSWAEMELYEA